jgi:sec-independent protein translocase protein TatB
MFDIAPTELLLCALVALVVIGPKDLPKAMRVVGHWVGRARGMARQFRSGFDAMVREAELDEMEKKWAAENERIMREHPPEPSVGEADASVTQPPADPVAPTHPAIWVDPAEPVPPVAPADPIPPAPDADAAPVEAPKPAGQLDLGLGGAPTDPKS